MDKTRLEIKVGLFVFVCLAVLATMMVAFNKGGSLLNDSYTLKLHTTNVGGLKHEAQVLLAGYPVGDVRDIQIEPGGKSVTIFLKIYKKYEVYHDARFVIEQAGFLGDEYIAIIPTDNQDPKLTDGADVQCQEPFDLQEVARGAAGFIKRMDETAKKLEDSVTDLRAQVLNAQTLSTFGVALTNMQKFTAQAVDTIGDINSLVATNGVQFNSTVSNLVVFSSELSQVGSSAQDVIATNRLKLNEAMQNLDDASATLKQITADVQAGRGLAGTVLQNQELATNVQLIAANLAVTTSNLNRTGLWGILWSHKTPVTHQTNQPAKK